MECGIPDGVINVLTGYGKDFGDELVSAKEVALVSYTGGEKTGEAIAAAAGIKKLAMELGANSPVIVTGECSLSKAVASCVSGAFWASGQNCLGVQRIFVHRSCYEEFTSAFVRKTQELEIGDPRRVETFVGPMISPAQLKRVENWVAGALEQGGELLCGGAVYEKSCYLPTVIAMEEHHRASIIDEEVFGPVVTLHPYSDLDDAIDMANKPDYMIHAAIFSDNIKAAMHASRKLQCSGVIINDSTDYRLDAMPFGGAKRGAMGREGVKFAIQEMVQTKTICMNLGT